MTVNTSLAKKLENGINLFDLPENRFYAKTTNMLTNRIKNIIIKDYKSITNFANSLNTYPSSFHGWIYKSQFPLSILKKISFVFNIKEEEILENVVYIKSGLYPNNGGGNVSFSISCDFHPVFDRWKRNLFLF